MPASPERMAAGRKIALATNHLPAVNSVVIHKGRRCQERAELPGGNHATLGFNVDDVARLKVVAEFIHLEQPEPLLELQRRLKAVFDPHHVLNPGRFVV